MKKALLALMCIAVLTSCQKTETEPGNNSSNNNNNNNNSNNGFTPPTESYWKINGTANSASNDAVQVDLDGGNLNLAKPFTDLGYGYCHLRVFFNGNENIRESIEEGKYKAFPVTITTSSSVTDSIRVELDVEGGGNYFYRATAGVVYISKKDGKLRFTSKDKLPMSGVKYPDMQSYSYNCELEFSQTEAK